MNSTPALPKLSRRQLFVSGLVAAGGFVIAGCGSDSDGADSPNEGPGGAGGSSGESKVLRIGYSGQAPASLDPAKGGLSLPYEPLIEVTPDGNLEPRLAASWQYIGDGNTLFEIVLRPDVVFSDGTPVNSEALKASIAYYRDPAVGSQAQQYLAAVSDVEIVDDLTVRIHLSEPHPLMPQVFGSHHYQAGYVISPAALADPETLATASYGAGKYILEPSETVSGDHYTFVPSPTYWNQEAIYWDKIVISFRPDENATLAALQSGQLDVAMTSYATTQAGIDAGLSASGPGTPIVMGVSLWDREGQVNQAIGDVRVRQALNYAVDREKITSALIGEPGIPTDQLSAPNQAGWSQDGYYAYDPDKARQLLDEAGYADGLSITVRAPRDEFIERILLAAADDLRQVGVELTAESVPDYDQANDAVNQGFAAGFVGWGVFPAYLMGRSFWLPEATNNPFDSNDPTLVELDKEAAASAQEARVELDKQIVARVAENAWFLPILLFGNSMLYHEDVVDLPEIEPGMDLPNADLYRPANA